MDTFDLFLNIITALAKNSGTLENVCAKFYTSFELNFIYVVSVVIDQAFILCHTNFV